MNMTADVIFWKYGSVADTADGKITAWRRLDIPQPDEIQLEIDRQEYVRHMASVTYREKRAREYPTVGDQLDAMWKLLNSIPRGEGLTDSQKEAFVVLDSVIAVKSKYPKPTAPAVTDGN